MIILRQQEITMNPDIVIKGIKGTGLLVSAIFGGVAGFMYQNWVTQADLHVDYTLAKYEESYALPSGIANQLRGRADVVDYGEAMVVWPFKQALNFNSWQRYELEDLLKLLEPLERESDSDVSDLEAIKTLVGG